MNPPIVQEASKCYWQGTEGLEHWYITEDFGFPVFWVSMVTQGPRFGHEVCAFQVREDRKDFNSYRFFQYDSGNIRPSDWQMPCGFDGSEITLTIYKLDRLVTCTGCMPKEEMKWKLTGTDQSCLIERV